MGRPKHIDHVLKDWAHESGDVVARLVKGADGRDVLQMRLEMGLLQLEVEGRPDGERPEGFDTYYDYLISLAFSDGEEFKLDDERCHEIDREFVQFYHRRICWLALREYLRAAKDADHSLGLMDFSSAHAPTEEWALTHEQYRPFVIFHRTQALALYALQEDGPEKAIQEIDDGLQRLRVIFVQYDAEDSFEEDELVKRLGELKESMREHYKIGPATERLADAVATEQYELAAQLRDEIQRKQRATDD